MACLTHEAEASAAGGLGHSMCWSTVRVLCGAARGWIAAHARRVADGCTRSGCCPHVCRAGCGRCAQPCARARARAQRSAVTAARARAEGDRKRLSERLAGTFTAAAEGEAGLGAEGLRAGAPPRAPLAGAAIGAAAAHAFGAMGSRFASGGTFQAPSAAGVRAAAPPAAPAEVGAALAVPPPKCLPAWVSRHPAQARAAAGASAADGEPAVAPADGPRLQRRVSARALVCAEPARPAACAQAVLHADRAAPLGGSPTPATAARAGAWSPGGRSRCCAAASTCRTRTRGGRRRRPARRASRRTTSRCRTPPRRWPPRAAGPLCPALAPTARPAPAAAAAQDAGEVLDAGALADAFLGSLGQEVSAFLFYHHPSFEGNEARVEGQASFRH